MSFVLDNSVALTWCFEDERTPATTALLVQIGESGALAPGLWPLEALNGLLVPEHGDVSIHHGGTVWPDSCTRCRSSLMTKQRTEPGLKPYALPNGLGSLLMTPLISNSLSVTACRLPRWIKICEPRPRLWAFTCSAVERLSVIEEQVGKSADLG